MRKFSILPRLACFAGLFVAPLLPRAAEFDQRLLNLSARAQAATGDNAPIVGFVIGAGPAKRVLIRAIGPGMSAIPGIGATLANPKLELYAGPTKIAENDNWTTSSIGGATGFSAVGAFPLPAESRDAALLTTLGPGGYTARVTGVETVSGVVLLEVYDVTGQARLINLSTRAMVGTGAGILISGVAIAPGGGARKMLVRAAGPALRGLFPGLPTLADPAIAVIQGATQIASNNDWGDGKRCRFARRFRTIGCVSLRARFERRRAHGRPGAGPKLHHSC